jgi:uncharacterized LabA/DUF88 family protein
MSQKKTIILVDIANIEHSLLNQKGSNIKDWKELMTAVCEEITGNQEFDAVVYMPISQPPQRWEHRKKTWLEGRGYLVIQKNKTMKSSTAYKADIDVELCVGFFRALEKEYEHIILFSGDGDFLPLFKLAADRNVKFSVASVPATTDSQLWKSAKSTGGKVFDIDDDSPGIEKQERQARSSKQPVHS